MKFLAVIVTLLMAHIVAGILLAPTPSPIFTNFNNDNRALILWEQDSSVYNRDIGIDPVTWETVDIPQPPQPRY